MNNPLLLMAFDSTQQALRAEMLLEYADIEIDLCPTPKQVTAGCALSIQFPKACLEQVKDIIVSETVVIRGIFKWEEEQYIKIV
jgi:DNA-binding transcriptional regulator WhiA